MAVYSSYAEVPWFRKNWFVVLGFLIFAPAPLYSLFTGDIYYEKKGQLVTYSKTVKTIIIVLCSMSSIWLAGNILGVGEDSDLKTIHEVACNPQATLNDAQEALTATKHYLATKYGNGKAAEDALSTAADKSTCK